MFPLFHLEPKSQYDIFQLCDTHELFNISLLSKKCFQLAKQVIEKTGWFFNIELHKNPSIWLKFEEKPGKEYYFKCKSLAETVNCSSRLCTGELNGLPYLQNLERTSCSLDLNLYWEDEQEGFQKLAEHLLNLYGNPWQIDNLSVNLKSKNVLKMVDFVQEATKRREIIQLEVFAHGVIDSFINEVLDKLNYAEKCFFNVKPGPDFIQTHRQYEYGQMVVSDAYWVNWQHLLTFNCSEILLEESKISCQDINLYLKEWIKGACSDVSKVELIVNELNWNAILADIPFFEKPWQHWGNLVTVSYVIKRNDGKFGTISTHFSPWPVTGFSLEMKFSRYLD